MKILSIKLKYWINPNQKNPMKFKTNNLKTKKLSIFYQNKSNKKKIFFIKKI